MTYKFKYRDFIEESGEFKQDELNELAVSFARLLANGINFKMIVDSKDQEYFTVITEA